MRSALLAVLVPVTSCTLAVDTAKRPSCSTNAECTQRYGEPSACVESSCVKLLTEECTQVLPEGVLEEDNTILFGFMGALTGDFASYGTPAKEGAQVAFDEIETFPRGIPGAGSSTRNRHVGMLVCDHGADPEKVARHLAEEVKVPAIIGPSFSSVALQILDVTVPAQTLVLSPQATSPALTDVKDNGLFWRTCPSDVVQTELMKHLLVTLVDSLHGAGTIPTSRDANVAIVYKDDSAGRGLELGATTPFDGLNPAPPVTAEYEDKYPADPTNVDWSPYASRIAQNAPDVIMALGTGEFAQYLLPAVEMDWNPNATSPWYILPEGDRVTELTDNVTMNPGWGLPSRAVGTAPGPRKSPLYQHFKDAFYSEFQRQPGNLAEFAYDAAYLLLYATAISGDAYPTGPDLAEALKDVSCPAPDPNDPNGNKVPVGPTKFSNYFELAANTQCIDFDGASGPLQFDNATGEAVSDIAMWCLRNQNGTITYDPPLDSYYSASQGAIVWKNDKPIDFTQANWCDSEGQ